MPFHFWEPATPSELRSRLLSHGFLFENQIDCRNERYLTKKLYNIEKTINDKNNDGKVINCIRSYQSKVQNKKFENYEQRMGNLGGGIGRNVVYDTRRMKSKEINPFTEILPFR